MMLGGLTRSLRAGHHSVRHASATAAAAKMKHFSVRMTDSGVAIITYDRPDNKVNALNAEVGAELQQTLQAIVSLTCRAWCVAAPLAFRPTVLHGRLVAEDRASQPGGNALGVSAVHPLQMVHTPAF